MRLEATRGSQNRAQDASAAQTLTDTHPDDESQSESITGRLTMDEIGRELTIPKFGATTNLHGTLVEVDHYMTESGSKTAIVTLEHDDQRTKIYTPCALKVVIR